MTIEEFWNQAFLAALTRLPPHEAIDEAERATNLCTKYWQEARKMKVASQISLWKDQEITQSSPPVNPKPFIKS